MAKDNSNANGDDSTLEVHLVLNGKGGVGKSAVAAASTERNVVIWLNEYFGQVVRDGRRLTEMQVYTDNQDKVLASIGIRERSPDTYGETVGAMRLKKLTFEEAISSPEFKLVE